MPLTINMQFNMIFFSLLSGVITGLLFDVYRLFREHNSKKYITFIEDILFWILVAITVFTILLYTNYAFFSFYVYILLTMGIIFYLEVLSKSFYSLEKVILDIIVSFIRIFIKRINYLFRIISYTFIGKDKK